MKRSNAPIVWLLFGAGGMLAALLGIALVLLTGIAAPLGWPFGPQFMSYPRTLAFSQHWIGKGFIFAVITLFAWHALHRIYHSLHDLGIPIGTPAKIACYGAAMIVTLAAGAGLISIGF